LPQNQVARLGVMAAVSSPTIGLKSWLALLEAVPFDDLPNSVIRLLPRIYWNLRGLEQVPEKNRIRGGYKLNWARNAQLQSAFNDLWQQLKRSSIPFQVVKGVAVGATTGLVGARVMGDIDLVVKTSDVTRVRRTLETLGYSLRDNVTPSSIHGAGAYFDGKRNVIDVHTWEDRPLWLSQYSGELVTHEWKQSTVTTFPPQVLAAHALGHGSLSTAESDISQALVDFSDLRRLCDTHKLLGAIRQSAQENNLEEMLQELDECLLESEAFLESARWLSSKAARNRNRSSVKHFLRRLLLLPATLWRRRLSPKELILLARLTIIRPSLLLYSVWSTFGRLQVVERAIRRFRLNLAAPGVFFERGGPLGHKDFRQAIPRSTHVGDEFSVIIRISPKPGEDVHPQSFALAIDGQSFGYFPPDSSNVGRYLVKSQLPSLEVSLRKISHEKSLSIDKFQIELVPAPVPFRVGDVSN